MPFMDQMLDRLVGKGWYCFLDGYSSYYQISIASDDQENTTFTGRYGTFAFNRMPFGLCNAPTTFQRCMMSIFSDMVEDTLEVFMDGISVVGDTFDDCLLNLSKGTAFNWPWPDHFRVVTLPRVDELDMAIGRIGNFLKTYRQ